jgi:hypothetical protein
MIGSFEIYSKYIYINVYKPVVLRSIDVHKGVACCTTQFITKVTSFGPFWAIIRPVHWAIIRPVYWAIIRPVYQKS